MVPDLYIPTYTINDWKLWEGYWELIKGKLSETCVIEFDLQAVIQA